MDIKEIKTIETDSFPIGSITRSTITTVKPITESDNGSYQIIMIAQDEEELKLRLKCDNHFLDPNEDEGKEIEFMAGKPVNGKPVGIIFRNTGGKVIVNITEKCVMKLIEPITITEGSFDPEEEIPVTPCVVEEEPPQLTEFIPGPNDDYFLNLLAERLHLYKLTCSFFEQNNMRLPIESLSAITTGLIMDNVYAKKQVLHKEPHTSKKKKFEEIEKPHNPKREEKQEEEPAKETADPVGDWIKTQKGKGHYDQVDSKGAKLGVIMLDASRRRPALKWYFKLQANGKTPGTKTVDLYKSIGAFLRIAPSSISTAIVYDVIAWDSNPEYDIDKIDEVLEPIAEKFEEANALKLADHYFKDEE
jgi:hypothetical protein